MCTQQEEENDKMVKDCYRYMLDFSKIIFENEIKREESIINQAGRMQSAFSFITLSVLAAVPVIIKYRGLLSLNFLFFAFSSIVISIIISLIFATVAQDRKKRSDFPTISMIRQLIEEEYENFDSFAKRDKYLVKTYEKIHNDYVKVNEKRIMYIKLSTYSFYVAVALIFFWTVISLSKIL